MSTDILIQNILQSYSARELLSVTVRQLGSALACSRCIAAVLPDPRGEPFGPIQWLDAGPTDHAASKDALVQKVFARVRELAIEADGDLIAYEDVFEAPDLDVVRDELNELGIRSLMAIGTRAAGPVNAVLAAFDGAERRFWARDEQYLMNAVGRSFGPALYHQMETEFSRASADYYKSLAEKFGQELEEIDEESDVESLGPFAEDGSEDQYRRLFENSDAVVFHADAEHGLRFISKRASDFFGVHPGELAADRRYRWFDFVVSDDRARVQRLASDMLKEGLAFEDEFRIVNHVSGQIRWLLVKLVPVRSATGDVEGWDGFGIDISARRDTQAALDIQSKKIRALYTVSSAIRGYLDPANIASRGLAALCDATGACAGLCFLYPVTTRESLQLVAHHGFSAAFANKVNAISSLPSLSTHVVEQGQPMVVSDIRSDPRSSRILAEEEGMRSAVLVPVCVEEETLGSLALFSKEVGRFDGGDVMLVSAAANQIGLAARQANLFSAYRRQTKNLAALYRMSSGLSNSSSLDEVFQLAFSIIRDELGIKRMWLGLLNETGTRVIGQAAYGAGWKRRLVEINVEVRGREHPIARVVRTREPMVIDQSEEMFREFGVRKIFSRLAIQSVVLVPLQSAGQIKGVLAVQPPAGQSSLDELELNLLSSLANEIAQVVQTKRLEQRIGEGEKMRAAGLLAAGIAHNFNNLLQAILGQASLLDMQKVDQFRVKKAAKIINDAATKGADLVRQLLSFAHLEEPQPEIADINDVIDRNTESLRSLVREGIRLVVRTSAELPRAHVDSRHLVRIIKSLVQNANEAIDEPVGTIEVFTDTLVVDDESPQYEVPYGHYIRIGVRDSGRGMDEETRRRCFEPFYTTKNVDPASGLGMSGSGLGLAAAYALARRNRGRLVAEGRLGHGSLFTLYVPIHAEVNETETEPVISLERVHSLHEGIEVIHTSGEGSGAEAASSFAPGSQSPMNGAQGEGEA